MYIRNKRREKNRRTPINLRNFTTKLARQPKNNMDYHKKNCKLRSLMRYMGFELENRFKLYCEVRFTFLELFILKWGEKRQQQCIIYSGTYVTLIKTKLSDRKYLILFLFSIRKYKWIYKCKYNKN